MAGGCGDCVAPVVPWVISAKSAAALAAQAARLAEFVGQRVRSWMSLMWAGRWRGGRALSIGRWCWVVIGMSCWRFGRVGRREPGWFGGQRARHPGGQNRVRLPRPRLPMARHGRRIARHSPVFAEQINACAEAFAEFVDWSLIDVLRGAPGAPGLDRVDVVQPALFAVMVSLAELWRSVGVRPDAVIGHSQGEIAAAYVAGALSLRDAARVVTLRSKLLLALAGRGGMVSLACGAEQARELLAPFGDRISIAAINGRSAVVVSGEVAALDELVQQCTDRELRARRIDVDYASHSVDVECIREQLAEALSGIEPRSSRTAFFSTVTGGLLDTAGLDADYWYRNIRQTVEFDQAVRGACQQGYRTFIECSPHPALIAGIEDTFNDCTDSNAEPIVVPTLGRDDGGIRRFLTSAAQAFVSGVGVDWRAVLPGAGFVELPTYAFDRRRFWLSGDGAALDAAGLGLGASEHALLGAVVELPDSGGVVLTGRLSAASQSWLADHAVDGVVVFPGAGFVELAIRAGDEVGCSVVDELTLQSPLMLPASGSVAVQVVVGPAEESGQRSVSVFSRADADADSGWICHATGQLGSGSVEPARGFVGVAARGRDSRRRGRWLPAAGGARVRIRSGVPGIDRAVASRRRAVRRGNTAGSGRGVGGFGVHPVLLDAALHAAAITHDAAGAAEIALPFSWQGVSLHAAGASAVRARIAPSGPSAVSVELADGLGLPVLSVASMVARPVSQQQLMAAACPARAGTGSSSWCGRPRRPRRTPRRRHTKCSSPLRQPRIRSSAPTGARTRPWPRCSRGWPSTTRACWWYPPAAQWDCRGRTSPIWRALRCGGWCVRRRPSIPAGSFWWIPMRPLMIRR